MRTRTNQVIEVDGLRQRYGDFEAVAGISFEVGEGELFALLGTNGAGKTTTLETLEGFRPAHLSSAMIKLGESNRLAAVRAAREMGWI